MDDLVSAEDFFTQEFECVDFDIEEDEWILAEQELLDLAYQLAFRGDE